MGKKNVGGQAVIEGVYMRGESGCGTAVRLESGEIKASFDNKVPLNKKKGLWSKPFIRGVVGLIDSMVEGISKLNYSASFFEEVEAESKFEKWLEDKFGDKLNSIISVVTIIFSVFISLGLFMFILGVSSCYARGFYNTHRVACGDGCNLNFYIFIFHNFHSPCFRHPIYLLFTDIIHWVYIITIQSHTKMQMWSSRTSCTTYFCNFLTFHNNLSWCYTQF